MDMSETRANSSFPLNTPWPWISTYEVLSESNLSIPKSAVDCGQHRFWPSGIIHDRQLSADSVEKVAPPSGLRQNSRIGQQGSTQHDGTVIEWAGTPVLLVQP
jgi:hypothetical protein